MGGGKFLLGGLDSEEPSEIPVNEDDDDRLRKMTELDADDDDEDENLNDMLNDEDESVTEDRARDKKARKFLEGLMRVGP